MTDPDFPRGGDAFSGPDVRDPATPETPDFSAVHLDFRVADRYLGIRSVRMTWIDPKGEAEELLLRLWRLWYAEAIERAKIAGIDSFGTF